MDVYRDRIRPLFDRSGLSDREIAALIGISVKHIYNWNNGVKSYNKYYAEIANAFHVSVAYLKGETDDPQARDAEKPAPTDGNGLSDLEKRWLQIIDDMSAEQVEKLISIVEKVKEMAKGM